MRILFCNKFLFRFSGTEAYLLELRSLLESEGHQVEFFAMSHPRNEPATFEEHFPSRVDFNDNHLPIAGQIRLAGRVLYSREARKGLREVVERFRPDVAHVRNIYHHLSPSLLWQLRAQGVPVVYHLNDFKLICPNYNLISNGSVCERCKGGRFHNVVLEGCHGGSVAKGALLAIEAYAHAYAGTYSKCVDVFLAPSAFAKQKLVENGWPEERISVLPHFQLPAVSHRTAGEGRYVVYFGRLSLEKGVEDAVRAMAGLPEIPFKVAGEGPERPRLERLGARLGADNIQWLGHLEADALADLLEGCRLAVLPSRVYEVLGKSILEAYGHARPVISTDLGSRREVVKDGETGRLVQVGAIDELTSRVRELFHQPELVTRMGEQARRFVQEHHSPEKHLGALMSIYERARRRAA